MTRTRPLRRPTLALGALVTALLLTLSGALTGAASAAEAATGWIRVGHLSPGTPKAEVRLTPFAGGETRVVAEADFGDLSTYERVPVGLYTVSLAAADQPEAEAMLSQNVEITNGGARTVIATGTGAEVRATVLDDDLTPPADGRAKVRLISASTTSDVVSAQVVDGPTLASDLATGSSTGYAEVPAQEWRIQLAAGTGDQTTESAVPVQAGGVYSLVALDTPDGELELRAILDSAGSTGTDGAMPTGGVDAGAGGLAGAADQGGVAVAPMLAVGALLALAGGAAVVRRGGTS